VRASRNVGNRTGLVTEKDHRLVDDSLTNWFRFGLLTVAFFYFVVVIDNTFYTLFLTR
jgi:hypothetical protein